MRFIKSLARRARAAASSQTGVHPCTCPLPLLHVQSRRLLSTRASMAARRAPAGAQAGTRPQIFSKTKKPQARLPVAAALHQASRPTIMASMYESDTLPFSRARIPASSSIRCWCDPPSAHEFARHPERERSGQGRGGGRPTRTQSNMEQETEGRGGEERRRGREGWGTLRVP